MDAKNRILEENIGVILSTLVAAFILGTTAMVYSTNKNSEIFEVRLMGISKSMDQLTLKVDSSVMSRWTKQDQIGFEDRLNSRVEAIEIRLLRNESEIFSKDRNINNNK